MIEGELAHVCTNHTFVMSIVARHFLWIPEKEDRLLHRCREGEGPGGQDHY